VASRRMPWSDDPRGRRQVRMLDNADPITKAALYANLGLTLTYEHDRRVVRTEAQPGASCANERVGGGLAL
jgi:hypothetical protein